MYPNAKNICLQVETDDTRLHFKFLLGDGPTSEKDADYGIYIAELAAFPPAVIEHAKELSTELRRRKEEVSKKSGSMDNAAYYSLIQSIGNLKHTTLPLSGVRRYLQDVAHKFGFDAAEVS